jgi:hypothetical protein
VHSPRPKPSKESLLRQVSMKNHNSRLVATETLPRDSSRFSFEAESLDIADLGLDAMISNEPTRETVKPSFILYPDLRVVPEVDSVDASGEGSIWVAVLISGILRRAVDYASNSDTVSTNGFSECGTDIGQSS